MHVHAAAGSRWLLDRVLLDQIMVTTPLSARSVLAPARQPRPLTAASSSRSCTLWSSSFTLNLMSLPLPMVVMGVLTTTTLWGGACVLCIFCVVACQQCKQAYDVYVCLGQAQPMGSNCHARLAEPCGGFGVRLTAASWRNVTAHRSKHQHSFTITKPSLPITVLISN